MALAHTVQELRLKNGMQGLLIDVPGTSSVYYDICFRAGTDYVADPTKSQAAHIMEHLSFGANAQYDSQEAFSQEFSKNGAYQNAHTGSVSMEYEAAAPLMEWDRILGLQTVAITTPRYSQAALDTEKSNVLEELQGYATNHGRILWQELMRASGLRRWYDPQEKKSVSLVTLHDIEQHFAYTHTRNNLRFVFAGHLQPHRKQLMAMLESWQLPEGTYLPLRTDVATSGGAVFIPRADLPTLTFNLTFFINRQLTRDELRTMGVLCHVLTDTFHSRIFGKARSRGLCYGMGANFSTSPTGVATFAMGGQVSFTNANELFVLIMDELNDVRRHGITSDELRQAKEYRLGSLQMANETVRAVVNWYIGEYYDSGRIDHLDDMPSRIAKTTIADIKALLSEFLDTNICTFGGIGNGTSEQFKSYYDVVQKALQ